MNEKFLTDLLSCVSVSGYEGMIQDRVAEEMSGCSDQIRRDEMDNLVCVMNPESKTRIMLSAHADEIGLMISHIREDGRLQVVDRGGIVPATYPGQQIKIIGKKGEVYGVVEASRELFKDENLGTKQFLLDIGAKNRADALQYVDLGAPVVPDTHIRKMANGRMTARAFDNRIGVFVIMEAMKRAKERGCKNGVYAAATTGEETTKNGAYWCSVRIRPTIAVVVDVTYTGDCLGMDPSETGEVKLGGGPVLCNSPIVARGLNQKMARCAEEAGIPVQWEAASRLSHTDADQIHFSNEGVPVLLFSVPLRYMHMPAEVADMKDVEACIELLSMFLGTYR